MNLSKKSRRAFTLAEVMIASTLSVIVIAGVTSSLLMFTKLGYRTGQYTEMENETRRCLEQFGQDARMSKRCDWTDANTITLTVVINDNPTNNTKKIKYAYTPNGTKGTLKRTDLTTNKITESASGISLLTFIGYGSDEAVVVLTGNSEATNIVPSNNTKQIQLSYSAERSRTTAVKTEQKVVSARYILRNKN